MKRILSVLGIAFFLTSCADDDNGIQAVPPRLLSEVETENRQEIITFLKTHFYNYDEFLSPPANFDFKIRVDTIAGDNADKIPLIQQVDSAIINVSSFEFALNEEEEDIQHQYYYLNARKGIEEKANPTVADSVFVRYEGKLLSGVSFDGSTTNPIWFDLARIQAPVQGGFRGFSEGMVNFKPGGDPIVNPDGTFAVENYGVGMMIFPSGLGAYNAITGGIPQYSPLIFEIDLFTINPTDHDNDGIPSILEDVNRNGYLYDDNTDEEDERAVGFSLTVDFLDVDDDDDGISTRDEISDENGNIIFPYPSTGNVPDYLNKDVQRTPSDN